MNRRNFLKTVALGSGGALLSQVPFSGALAQEALAGSTDRVLVTVFLRGGWDALNVLSPADGSADYADYLKLRPTLRMARAAAAPLAGTELAMHKSLYASLGDLWTAGRLAVIPRAGSTNQTRSHFTQQDCIESGSSTRVLGKGILARAATLLAASSSSPLSYLAFGGAIPQSLAGLPAIVFDDVHRYGVLDSSVAIPAETIETKLSRYGLASAPGMCEVRHGVTSIETSVCGRARIAQRVVAKVNDLKVSAGIEKVVPRAFGETAIGRHLYQAAQLIRGDGSIRFVNVDLDGFDTHFDQGVNLTGALSDRLQMLGKALSAFYATLSTDGTINRVTVLVMSEFGRTTRENFSGGTDHGRGGLALVLGGRVNGRAGLAAPFRKAWRLSAAETSTGTSRALGLDKPEDQRPQADVRHIMARSLAHVLRTDYGAVRGLFDGAALPNEDELDLFART